MVFLWDTELGCIVTQNSGPHTRQDACHFTSLGLFAVTLAAQSQPAQAAACRCGPYPSHPRKKKEKRRVKQKKQTPARTRRSQGCTCTRPVPSLCQRALVAEGGVSTLPVPPYFISFSFFFDPCFLSFPSPTRPSLSRVSLRLLGHSRSQLHPQFTQRTSVAKQTSESSTVTEAAKVFIVASEATAATGYRESQKTGKRATATQTTTTHNCTQLLGSNLDSKTRCNTTTEHERTTSVAWRLPTIPETSLLVCVHSAGQICCSSTQITTSPTLPSLLYFSLFCCVVGWTRINLPLPSCCIACSLFASSCLAPERDHLLTRRRLPFGTYTQSLYTSRFYI